MSEQSILYMKCPFHEKTGDFSASQEINEDEYVRMLREYSATIGKGSVTSSKNNRYNFYDVKDFSTQDEEIISKTNVIVYDMSGVKCTVNDIYNIKKNGMAVIILEILEENMEEAFEEEYKFWKQDSMKINNDTQLEQDDRIRFLPIKDLELEMEYHVFKLEGCKLYHDYNNGKIALIVKRIIEI